MYAVLILFFYYFVLKLFTQRQCVKVTFLKFQVLRERSSVIASFPEHPVHSNFEMFSVLIIGFLFWLDFPEHPVYDTFEMFSVLILGLLFWFPVTYPKNMCESNLFFVILGAPKTILLLSWSTLHIAISKCIVSWFFFFLFWFPTIHPKCFYKSHLFLKF